MNATVAAPHMPPYRLTSDLNRECLPSSEKDPNRKVAWMNAICLSVLLVGVAMTKQPAQLAFVPELYQTPQPIDIIKPQEPQTPPQVEELKPEDIQDSEETPRFQPVVVVAADPSKVPVAIPVVGATAVSSDIRQVSAPPKLLIVPKPAPAPLILKYAERGSYGDLPWPTDRDYPTEAKSRKESGDVIMVIDVGPDGGAPTDVTIEKSSNSSYLDAHARDWVRTRWKFKPIGERKRFKFMFSYQLAF